MNNSLHNSWNFAREDLHKSYRDHLHALNYREDMTTKEESGARIKRIREKRDLTLQQVSDATGGAISVSRLSNFEQGTRMMSVDAAKAIAPVLGTTPEYLLTLTDIEPDPQEVALIEFYRACDNRGKMAAIRVAEEQAAYAKNDQIQEIPENDENSSYPGFRKIKATGLIRAGRVSRTGAKRTLKEDKK